MSRGQRELNDLIGLPAGLDSLYYDSMERVVKLGGRDWLRDYAPLFGALSVALSYLTLDKLPAFTYQPVTNLWTYLGELEQFVKEAKKDGKGASRFSLYHHSVVDFLRLPEFYREGR